MSKLYKDILYLIFQELQDNKETLYTCLFIDKTWCETIIPILWKDPWKFLKNGCKLQKRGLLLNLINSNLSDESRNKLGQYFNFSYKKPLFNYISYCKYLNLTEIKKIINNDISFIQLEIINLLINENTKFTHLYIPKQFNYQINIFPGFQNCFSDIIFLSCSSNIDDNVLDGLSKICKSIKELELIIDENNNNCDIIKLIDIPTNLINVRLLIKNINYEPFHKILEKSLMKQSNTIRYLKITKQPTLMMLSSFIYLIRLELDCCCLGSHHCQWNCLENLSLPFLQILKARYIPIKPLTNLIENTSGSLDEIKIDYTYHSENDNKRIIQVIYHNCLNLKYLTLVIKSNNLNELEKLLITCKYLIKLNIITSNKVFDWNNLFDLLIRLSPISLYKFKFYNSYVSPGLDSLKLFLDNWKGRNPLLLKFNITEIMDEYSDLIEKYKAEGVINKFDYYSEI